MSKPKWETSLFRLLIQHLRVPELVYPFEMASADAQQQREEQVSALLDACTLRSAVSHNSITQLVTKLFGTKGCFAQANNMAFFLDRVFDVWLRKNLFPDELANIFNTWRFMFFRFSLPFYAGGMSTDVLKKLDTQLDKLICLLDEIGRYASIWSPVPKRSMPILLDQLKQIELLIHEQSSPDAAEISGIYEFWRHFSEKQTDKVDKITERLIQGEHRKTRSQFCLWLAYHYLNILFKNRQVPLVLQSFLAAYWVNVVAQRIESSLPDQVSTRESIIVGAYDDPLDQCCKNIVRVFCHKGESSFQLADQIIDDLQKMSAELDLPQAQLFNESQNSSAFFSIDSLWQELSDCLVAVLQGQMSDQISMYVPLELPEHLKQTFGDVEQFKSDTVCLAELNVHHKDWFALDEPDERIHIQLIADFEQSRQVLFSNYLGMKAAQFSYEELRSRMQQGNIRKRQKIHSFSSVFDQAVKGLSKIAENQKQARLQAAEKAKAEAEKLLEDRRKSEELSQQRAQEIAERTKQLLAKRADKQRLEKENTVAQLIRGFNVGAWIAISDTGEPQRFKLVVKLLATGKYVFVDRLGIKKREFMEAELVQLILRKEIEILSDGAEFEESLERVVSRIRMSK
jgi:transcription elongation GreA/GreB family factor